MNGSGPPQKQEKIDPKTELEVIRVQIHNARHSMKMLEAMEKKLMELIR